MLEDAYVVQVLLREPPRRLLAGLPLVGDVGALLQVQLHANFEHTQRGKGTRPSGSRHVGQLGHLRLQVGAGRQRQREPQVERVISLVVVADCGKLRYPASRLVDVLFGDVHGDQGAGVAQAPAVEDGANLADDADLLQTPGPRQDILLANAELFADDDERTDRKREVLLD